MDKAYAEIYEGEILYELVSVVFSLDYDVFGVVIEHEVCPLAREVVVT